MKIFWMLIPIVLIGFIGVVNYFLEESGASAEIDFNWFDDLDEKLIIVSIIVGITTGLLVNVLTKTKADKTFQKNSKMVYENLFSHISSVDSCKQNIYEILEPHDHYKNSDMMVLHPDEYKEIQIQKEFILNEIMSLTLYKNSPYIILSEYLLLLQYASSAYSHLYEIRNHENGMGVNEKSLEYHRYYAKEIIDKVAHDVPESFSKKWNTEFKKMGRSQFIVEPYNVPGDLISAHHNLRNELFNFDAQYARIVKRLEEIKNSITNNNSDSS